ncbi:flagellar hook-associated protein [Fibrobacteres bacterium R8-0-B4]
MALDMKTQMRLTGMASGLDTDAIIQNLGKVNTMRINKVKQDKQLLQWKQESYRETITKLNAFAKSNLNTANPASNFRSSAAFAKFSYSLKGTIGGIAAADLMSVTANGDLKNFSQTVQGVAQLATKDSWAGAKMDLQGIKTSGFDFTAKWNGSLTSDGDVAILGKYAHFGISIDGTSRSITLDPGRIRDAFEKTLEKKGLSLSGDTSPTRFALIDSIVDKFVNDELGTGVGKENYYRYNGTDFSEDIFSVLSISGLDPGDSDYEDQVKAAVETFFADKAIYGDWGTGEGPKTSGEAFADLLNEEIRTQFGANFSNIVSVDANDQLKFFKSGSNITVFEQTGFSTLADMGLGSGASTAGAAINKTLGDIASDLFPVNIKEGTITINGVDIKLNKDDTMKTVMDKINNSDAGVTLSYSNATDSFTLASKLEGTANEIKPITGVTAELFSKLGIGTVDDGVLIDGNGDDGVRTGALNFIGIINGEEFVRQSNTFTHEGMTYTFNKTFNASLINGSAVAGPEDPLKIEVSKNTTDIIANIKGFIDEYNSLVTHLNDLLTSKRVRSKSGVIEYPPLTDDERKALSAEEAKLYDEKAKTGLMANDSQLRKVLSDMRTAIYQKIEGVGITMSDIGITTTANYQDGGLLVINEEKLKTALENRYDDVVSLFTKTSSIPSSEKDSTKLAQRYSEIGIAQRLNDIITSAAGTSLGGDKGYLVQKAGAVNDRTQFDNPMTKQLDEYDKKIDALLERWYRQEENYYAMFARMETAMSKLQAQQNSLAQIMAAGSGGQ